MSDSRLDASDMTTTSPFYTLHFVSFRRDCCSKGVDIKKKSPVDEEGGWVE